MRSIKMSFHKHGYFTTELSWYAKYAAFYPPPSPTREPSVPYFTLLGMGMHSMKFGRVGPVRCLGGGGGGGIPHTLHTDAINS